MKKLLYNKKLIILAIFIASAIIGTFFISINKDKQAYDYTIFYENYDEHSSQNNNEILDEPIIDSLSLQLLQQRNPDIIGILEFNDRFIYEPIVQAGDEQFYVRRNIDKHKVSAGIPFITSLGNFDSTNVVIYGHSSTKDNIIFTPLMNYKDEAFYKENKTFNFVMNLKTNVYEIASVFTFDTTNMDESVEFAQTQWRKLSDYALFLSNIKYNSM